MPPAAHVFDSSNAKLRSKIVPVPVARAATLAQLSWVDTFGTPAIYLRAEKRWLKNSYSYQADRGIVLCRADHRPVRLDIAQLPPGFMAACVTAIASQGTRTAAGPRRKAA